MKISRDWVIYGLMIMFIGVYLGSMLVIVTKDGPRIPDEVLALDARLITFETMLKTHTAPEISVTACCIPGRIEVRTLAEDSFWVAEAMLEARGGQIVVHPMRGPDMESKLREREDVIEGLIEEIGRLRGELEERSKG